MSRSYMIGLLVLVLCTGFLVVAVSSSSATEVSAGTTEHSDPVVDSLQAEAPAQITDQDPRIQQVVQAMGTIAKTEWPHDIDKLLGVWEEGYTVDDWAAYFVRAADAHGVDPILLVAITWQEGKFKVRIRGDKKKGKYRSCGPTQVRVDYPGRPSCQQLMDPDAALGWTASFLAARCKGQNDATCLRKYNPGRKYVRVVSRHLDLMRRSLL